MTTFTDWLADPNVERILLAEVKYYSGSEKTRYLSSGRFYTGSTDTPVNTIYDNRIIGDPVYIRNQSAANIGYIEIDNADGQLDSWINDSWAGRGAVLKLGDPSWTVSQYGTIYNGNTKRFEITDTTIRLVLQEAHAKMDIPVQPNLYTSGSNADKRIPLCYGTCSKVTPTYDGTTYQVHDGSVTDVCSQLYVDGATSAIGVTKNNTAGTFTLASVPSGKVTCDVVGYLATPGEIINEMISHAGAGITVNSFAAFDTTLNYTMGLYIKDDIKLSDAIKSLLPLGWYYRFNRDGSLTLDVVAEPGTSVLDLDDSETQGKIEVKLLASPHWRLSLNYDKNYTVSNTGPDALTAELNGKKYFGVSTTEDATIKTEYTAALDKEYNCLIKTGAGTESLRLYNLYKVQRYEYKVTAYAAPFSINIGDTVTVTDNRYMLSSTKMIVREITEHFLGNKIDLVLWR